MPVRIISGEGCVSSFGKFRDLGGKCAIITGKNSHKTCPASGDVKKALSEQGVEYIFLAEAENNPTFANVCDMTGKVLSFGADFLVGIGGGSAMDAAKAAALFATSGIPRDGLLYDLNGNLIPDIYSYPYSAPLPLVLVGTTAGTGSEVTANAVITTGSTGDGSIVKKSVKTAESYARYAFCDPRYTETLSPEYTVGTALDFICHALEAMFSAKCGIIGKNAGLDAVRLGMPALEAFVRGKRDLSLRHDLLAASVIAGLAINDGGTTFPHALGYQLTNYHGLPHGYACAAFVGQFLIRQQEKSDISEVLRALGCADAEEFSGKVRKMMSPYCTVPRLTDDEAVKYTGLAMKNPGTFNNFLDLSREDILQIYKSL